LEKTELFPFPFPATKVGDLTMDSCCWVMCS